MAPHASSWLLMAPHGTSARDADHFRRSSWRALLGSRIAGTKEERARKGSPKRRVFVLNKESGRRGTGCAYDGMMIDSCTHRTTVRLPPSPRPACCTHSLPHSLTHSLGVKSVISPSRSRHTGTQRRTEAHTLCARADGSRCRCKLIDIQTKSRPLT